MSVLRTAAPLAMPTAHLFRFASSKLPCRMRPSQHAIKQFTSSPTTWESGKRKMQTSTAYHPYSLDTAPPPPRNASIPDTSIAGSVPQMTETRPPTPSSTEQSAPEVSITEKEAQKSQPVDSFTATSTEDRPAQTQTQAQTRPKARPKLRARKAAMKLTPTAVEQLRELLNQPTPKLIKVGVKNRGCSGLAYHLEYVEKPGTFDEAVEQDGVKVLIDSKALFSIIGSEMDWVEDKLNQRFVFKNPNIKEQCGCGESFMV